MLITIDTPFDEIVARLKELCYDSSDEAYEEAKSIFVYLTERDERRREALLSPRTTD